MMPMHYAVDHTTICLAVLPLQNMSDDPVIEMFCAGFVMDLITDLSRFRSFRIISRTAIESPESDKGEVEEERVEEGMQPDYIVKGLVRYQRDQLFFNIQLVNARENRLVWAERFGGPLEEFFQIQEEIVEKIVVSLQRFVDHDLLSEIRKKPLTNLNAYECWLRGYQELQKGTLEADEQARVYFRQAMEIDPHYARAYTGMSLTYFNEWSCQIWDRWEVSRKGAFEWGQKALELDEFDHVSAIIVGKIYLFNGEYDKAEHYLRKALRLNPNDADNLVQVAFSFTYLGYGKEALQLYEKACQLNPASDYFFCGAFVLFELGEFGKAIELGERHPVGKGWVDFSAFMAAAYYRLGNLERMQACWNDFLELFSDKINHGEPTDTQTAVQWMIDVNPYKEETELRPFWEYMGGNPQEVQPQTEFSERPSSDLFRLEGDLWNLAFEQKQVRLANLKGLHDIARLLATPDQEVHCTELAGLRLVEEGEEVFDEKAKDEYQKRLLALQEDLEDAELRHDTEASIRLQEEYDALLERLSASVGKGGKTRKVGGSVEKARTAVRWRIRSALKKIEEVHPSLAKHLEVSIKTGVFCEYAPEKEIDWEV